MDLGVGSRSSCLSVSTLFVVPKFPKRILAAPHSPFHRRQRRRLALEGIRIVRRARSATELRTELRGTVSYSLIKTEYHLTKIANIKTEIVVYAALLGMEVTP